MTDARQASEATRLEAVAQAQDRATREGQKMVVAVVRGTFEEPDTWFVRPYPMSNEDLHDHLGRVLVPFWVANP